MNLGFEMAIAMEATRRCMMRMLRSTPSLPLPLPRMHHGHLPIAPPPHPPFPKPISLSRPFFMLSPVASYSALPNDTPGERGCTPSALAHDRGGLDGVGGGGDRGPGGNGGSGPGDGGSGHGFGDSGDETVRKSFISWYLMLLYNHPVATKAVTSALLTFFGDLFCQLAIEKSETVDLKRIGIFSLLGLVLVGPTLHFWYLTLSKMVPGPGVMKAGLRLLLDQFLFSPIFIGVFFSALFTLEGRPSDIVPKLRQDWLNAVVANWKIWIPFQFLNFLLVPQQLQVLAANIIALAWNTYLSFATHTSVQLPSQKAAA